ncbi:hypothetical protein ZHAS_00013006 [Anopheles sinensis]|uniref:Uncharacterized protein n=1 Tax=Anopheles sinensis TaxID=74873 RepID=A0A084W4E4_ANOSI|nr:hypothetical protein ZHAS_00013006 [Anopheles sinensis]
MTVAGNSAIQLTSEASPIKDGIRGNLLKTEPGVTYTTIRQGNQQILTRIKLDGDDGQVLQQQQPLQQQTFQAQLPKVNVVTSSPLVAIGPGSQDNLTRVIESVAGNYGSPSVTTIGGATAQQVLVQQQPHQQLIQHVQTATGQQIRFEMDTTNHHHALLQPQHQQAAQLITAAQQHQPKFIITSRPITAVSAATATGTKLPLTIQTAGVPPQVQGQQFLHAPDPQHQQQLQLPGQATVTTLQKPIQLQKIIMSTPAIGQPQQPQQQRPRLPLQRTTQFSVQTIQQAKAAPQPPQAQPSIPTQSQQRFQQKFVTNQLIRGQNAILMNNVHQLQQQQAHQAAATVGANVVVGSTSSRKRASDGQGAATTTTTAAGGGGGSSSTGAGGGTGRRGSGRSTSSRLPPGAVNLERSYQICQAVIQNSPNRHQLKAQLKSPQAFLAASLDD